MGTIYSIFHVYIISSFDVSYSDLFIYDEEKETNSIYKNDDISLRDIRGFEIDIVSISYSYNLGLIATCDIHSTIMIWSYEDLSIVAILHNISNG